MKTNTLLPFSLCLFLLFIVSCSKQTEDLSLPASTSQSAQTGKHYIGEHFGGGVIFYLDATGQHGLIAAIADPEEPPRWSFFDTVTNARATRIGGGFKNTRRIVEVQGDPGANSEDYAALEIIEYTDAGYTDWFMPSKEELNQLYLQKNIIGGFSPFAYWSSTEVDKSNAWYQNFGDGKQYVGQKIAGYAVRPIRYF